MRHVLLLLLSLFLTVHITVAQTPARTLKSEMEIIHAVLNVNFVYDSTIELNIRYDGIQMQEILKGNKKDHAILLEECLMHLFKDTGLEYEVMRKYVVLTKAGAKKKPKDYTIFIEEQHDTLNESVITAVADPKRNATQTGLKRIDSKDLNSGFAFMSTPDVIKTLQMMPGVSSGTELLSGFYVHGGDGSDNLFLMDGVPVYQVSHLLGLFSSFNTDVIENMDFYKSGFPARYGSKMSSVVDITTRDGDFNEYHGLFALGLIDGRFQLEGPIFKGKTSFNFGLRRTWLETLTVPGFALFNKYANDPGDKSNLRYAFTDLNAKITHKFSDKSILSANFYMGRDAFSFMSKYTHTSYDDDNKEITSVDMTKIPFSWGNTIGSLNWDHEFNDNISMRNMLYYSGSLSSLGFTMEESESTGYRSFAGQSYNSDVHNMGLKSDIYHVLNKVHKLRYGAAAQYHIYNPSSVAEVELVTEDGQKHEYIPFSDILKYGAVEASVYGEDEISVGDAFSVNAGLRYSLYSSAGKTWHSLEPRVAMKYSFSENISAKASYTEMSQPAHLVSSLYIDLPTNAWLPSTSLIRPSRSREVAGGVYTHLAHNMHLNVEGWYKQMYNLLEFGGSYNIFPPLTGWETSFKSGRGRSWGAELDFGYDNGRTEANVYYTLSWSQRKFDDFYEGWYRDRNDNRHKLTLMAKHKFSRRFEIYGAWNWHSGNRVTIATHETPDGLDVYTEPNNIKLPDYHRLDVGMNFSKITKRGNTAVWNLSLYNAYCRANPITAYEDFKYVNGEKMAIFGSALGIIPIIPTFSYTLKF